MTSLVSICVNLWFYSPSMLVGLRPRLASPFPGNSNMGLANC